MKTSSKKKRLGRFRANLYPEVIFFVMFILSNGLQDFSAISSDR